MFFFCFFRGDICPSLVDDLTAEVAGNKNKKPVRDKKEKESQVSERESAMGCVIVIIIIIIIII